MEEEKLYKKVVGKKPDNCTVWFSENAYYPYTSTIDETSSYEMKDPEFKKKKKKK
jgi:hypothetical protein